MKDVAATFRNGVFTPAGPLALAEGTEVRLTIQPVTSPSNGAANPEGSAALPDSGQRMPRRPGSAVGRLLVIAEDDEHLKDFQEYMS